MAARIFLLSPASCVGKRAGILLKPDARFELARRLRAPQGVPLGEAFTFLSGLYFRGKIAYARRFANPPKRVRGVWVITPNAGLLGDDTRVTREGLLRFAAGSIDLRDPSYLGPLCRDLEQLAKAAGPETEFVLLGSVASGKYVEPLLEQVGRRLLFPPDFVGRGDMSRGGLLLRHAREGRELSYGPVAGAVRRGPRPPRLPKLTRTPARPYSQ